MSSVSDCIHELASRHGDREALVDLVWEPEARRYRRGRAASCAELHEATLRLVDALDRRGVRAGDRLAVLLDNSVELVVAEWACLVSGLVFVALNVRSSAAEHAAILEDCRPSVLIVSARHLGDLDREALDPSCLVVIVGEGGDWEDLLASGRAVPPARSPGPEDVVRIRYTSGTAGLPKGALLPRRCYDASVEVVTDVLGPLGPDDVLAQVAPMTHAAGAMWLPHALVGARALLADRFDAEGFVDLVAAEGVTSAFLVPTMLVRFLEALGTRRDKSDSVRTASLRSIVYGGAAMPVDRLERGLELLGPVFVQIYGLTESNWPITALRREDHVVHGPASERRRRLASCGRPTAVGELRIVDGEGRECAPGAPGEILVRGRNTMLGYWTPNRAGAEAKARASGAGSGSASGLENDGVGTEARARVVGDAKGLDDQGWMHTGDVALRDEEGFVTIVDRLHDMIVSGGFNVYPREVEDALSSHPAVLEAAVVGRPDRQWGEHVHAVVVLRPGASASEAELAAHVAGRTAAYKKPRSFRFVDELPKNAAGKVLRRALRTTTPPA